jgi:hypothetical protein
MVKLFISHAFYLQIIRVVFGQIVELVLVRELFELLHVDRFDASVLYAVDCFNIFAFVGVVILHKRVELDITHKQFDW